MISILRWIVVIAFTCYTALLYTSMSLALLVYAEVLLLVIAVLFLTYRCATMDGWLCLPISIVECASPLTVRLYVKNRSVLPCLKLKYQLQQGSHFLKKKRKQWLWGRSILPGENRCDYTMQFKNYGSYELRLRKIRIYDLTGLFYLNKWVNSCATVQIFPQIQEIGVHLTEASRNFCGNADVYDDFRPGLDSSELFGLRPFRNGDKIQSVHWKLSTKTDELLVKEDSMPKSCPVVFFLDYRAGKQRHERLVNIYLVILASISFSMMDAGCAHYAAWYSNTRQDVVRVRVDDEESLYLFLSCYLEESFLHGPDSLQDAYQEKYRGEYCLHMLYLNEALKLRKDQEVICEFNGREWEKKLRGLELII